MGKEKVVYECKCFDNLSKPAFENCEFYDCEFESVSFDSLKSNVFVDCKFNNCFLDNVSFSFSSLSNIEFNNCKIIGSSFASLSSCREIILKECNISYCLFNDQDFKDLIIKKCKVFDCDFTRSKMVHASLTENRFDNSNFNFADLTGADFSMSFNYEIDPTKAIIKDAMFDSPEVLGLLKSFQIIIN